MVQLSGFSSQAKIKKRFLSFKKMLTPSETLTLSSEAATGSVRKGVLTNFAKFTGKHLCQSLFFNKVAGLRQILQF